MLIASSLHGQAGGSRTRRILRAKLTETEARSATVTPDQCTERQHKNAERKCREKHGEARLEMSDARTSPREPANQDDGNAEQADGFKSPTMKAVVIPTATDGAATAVTPITPPRTTESALTRLTSTATRKPSPARFR